MTNTLRYQDFERTSNLQKNNSISKPKNSLSSPESADNGKLRMIDKILPLLQQGAYTSQMLHMETGIPLPAICKIKRDFELSGAFVVLVRANCKVTGFPADYYTANSSLKIQHKEGREQK